jgi:hypothetical protein
MAGKWGLGSDDTSDMPPPAAPKQQQVANPIGVPYYITDPSTGAPAVGPDNQRLRWGAQVPGLTNPHPGRTWADTLTTQYQLPRYFDGDQWLPAQLPPDQLANLQKKMVSAGLLKSGEAQLGIWDTNSMNAYTKLLAYANASGYDAQTALDRWDSSHTATGDQGTPRQPLVTKLSNPDDLKAVFRKAGIETLGIGFSSDQIDQMVNSYQQQERETQQQQYAMTGYGSSTEPGPGGEITAPPSPDAYAVTQARQQDPGLAQEHDALGMVNQFQNMVGQWSTVK